MNKKAYQVPEVKIKTLFMEQLMAAGSISAPDQGIDYGGVDNGDHEVDAKEGFVTVSSVWDD